jgi:hypothetical protein
VSGFKGSGGGAEESTVSGFKGSIAGSSWPIPGGPV